MNPKDMTNMQLVEAIKDQRFSLVDETKELLRRLNERDQFKSQWENCNSDFRFVVAEADALRKENEELRNLLGECPKRNNRLGTYSDAKPVQIDVCKLICMAKESEASHE